MLNKKLLVVAVLIMQAGKSAAGDISKDIRFDISEINENYFELGIGTSHFLDSTGGKNSRTGAMEFNINGYGEWNGLFIENYSDGYNGLTVGYKLWDEGDWSLDLIGSVQKHINFPINDSYSFSRDADSLDNGVNIGLRGSWRHQGTFAQLQLFGANTGDHHDGNIASFYTGQQWQWGKLNLHAMAGATYTSQSVNKYSLDTYFEGVQFGNFTDFDDSSQVKYNFELGATYQFTDHWSMSTTLSKQKTAGADSVVTSLTNEEPLSADFSVNFKF